MKKTNVLIFTLLLSAAALAQEHPPYTVKSLLTVNDGSLKDINADRKNGPAINYLRVVTTIQDISDDESSFIKISGPFLLCFEGTWKNRKKEGQFKTYAIDSINRSVRYKIWEQQYKNDRLNGEWRYFTLRGTLAAVRNYENDSLNGISRDYSVDGTIVNELDFLGNSHEYIKHELYPNGKVKRTVTLRNGVLDGVARSYYQDKRLMEEVNFKRGKFHGPRKYYYPNGQLWTEEIFKDGLDWRIISNFTAEGNPRDPGTLKDGNGTIIFYHEDGRIREVSTYFNGIKTK